MAGNHTLGTIRGTIEIDYDGAGIVKAVRDTDRAKSSFGTLDGASNKVLGAFAKFTKGAFTVAGAVDLVTNSIHVVAGALAIVGPLAAAGFAAAPGVILGFASALAIAKIATTGVGEALQAAGGDSKKFEESIKNLSPQAQKFAKAFRSALPALKNVRTAIQDAFFKGTAGQVAGVVKRIASLRPQAVGVAGAMGRLVQEFAKTATSSANINKLRLVLSGVNAFLIRIKGSIAPVVNGFINLASQAGQFGGTLGEKVAGALQKFGDFLGRIDLASLFETALPILQSLSGVFSNLAAIAGQLFGVFVADGGEAAGMLFELTDKLRTFLESAEGQAALDALGTAFQAISGAAGQVFLALLQALAPAIITLAPAITVLAGQMAGVLVPAINALAPVLQAVAGFIADNITWLGPLAGAVVAAAAAYRVYSAAATAVNAVQAALQSKMVVAAAAWTRNTAAVVANRVAIVASNVATGVGAVAAWVANTAAVVANRVAVLAAQGAMLVVKAATIAWTAVQWALNAALFANPIGLVILAIAALVAGIILAWKNSETFRNVVMAVWSAIKTAIAAVVDWITGTVWPSLQRAWQQLSSGAKALWSAIKSAWDAIKNAISTAINAVASVLKAVWNGIVAGVKGYINVYKTVVMAGFNAAKAVIQGALNAARAVVNAVWRAIVSFIRSQINAVKNVINGIKAVVTTIRNAFNQAKSAAQTALTSLVSLVRGIPGRVTGALGNLGSLLARKGRELIQGFIDGIKAMAGRVSSAAKGVVSSVTKFLPGSPAEEGPLSGKGYVKLRAQRFMTDFAKGLEKGSHEPVAALYGTVNHIGRAVVPVGSRTGSGPSATAPNPAAPPNRDRVYRIALGDKEFAELVVDAMTGKPKAVAKAASEGNRRTAWTGSGRKS